MNKNLKITADLVPWSRAIELRAAFMDGRNTAAAQPLVFSDHPEAEVMDPFLRLDQQAAQQLMDDLWRCGIRPTEGAGSVGQAAAMQSHLDDLRAITMHVLKVPRP